MDENIYFIIGDRKLILDKVLVEFNEAPIFFVCKSEQTYFIVSCVDLEKERYLVAEIRLSNLSKMLRGKITMRDLIIQANRFWEVTVGEDILQDDVIEKNLKTISIDELPYDNEYLVLATKDLKEYSEIIEGKLYSEETWGDTIQRSLSESVENFFKTVNEQYEIILESIYDNLVMKYIMDRSEDFDDETVYNKEISNDKINISSSTTTKLEIQINNNDKFPWAA